MSRPLTVQDSRLLFAALAANGVFSLLCGLLLAVAAAPLAALTGFAAPHWLLVAVGLALVVFGAALLWPVWRGCIRRDAAVLVSALDLAWVVATVVLAVAVPGLFNAVGVGVVVAVALAVLALCDLQAYALWRNRAGT